MPHGRAVLIQTAQLQRPERQFRALSQEHGGSAHAGAAAADQALAAAFDSATAAITSSATFFGTGS